MKCLRSKKRLKSPVITTHQTYLYTWCRERVLFIGTQFSILYTFMYSPTKAATPRA